MKRLLATAILLAVAAAAWTGAWVLLANRTERAIDEWIEAETSRDRLWSCANRQIIGFPFRLSFDCANPTLRSQSGPVRTGVAPRLTATAHMFSPFSIDINVDGPLKVLGPGGAATIQWSELSASLIAKAGDPDISLRSAGLRIDVSGEMAAWEGTRVQNLVARVQRSPDRAPDADARLLTINVDGVNAPPLDSMLESDEPFRMVATAVILNAGAANAGTPAERMDNWRDSGGRAEISSLVAEKGRSRLDASGELSVDGQRRPVGRLSVRVAGVQPILSKLKLPAAPLAIEGLLRGSASRGGGANLIENRTIPLELRAGRLYIGPVRTPVAIPPLL